MKGKTFLAAIIGLLLLCGLAFGQTVEKSPAVETLPNGVKRISVVSIGKPRRINRNIYKLTFFDREKKRHTVTMSAKLLGQVRAGFKLPDRYEPRNFWFHIKNGRAELFYIDAGIVGYDNSLNIQSDYSSDWQ